MRMDLLHKGNVNGIQRNSSHAFIFHEEFPEFSGDAKGDKALNPTSTYRCQPTTRTTWTKPCSDSTPPLLAALQCCKQGIARGLPTSLWGLKKSREVNADIHRFRMLMVAFQLPPLIVIETSPILTLDQFVQRSMAFDLTRGWPYFSDPSLNFETIETILLGKGRPGLRLLPEATAFPPTILTSRYRPVEAGAYLDWHSSFHPAMPCIHSHVALRSVIDTSILLLSSFHNALLPCAK